MPEQRVSFKFNGLTLAGVVRVPCDRDGRVVMKHLAFAVDCNGRHVELDPEMGAKMAIAEVCVKSQASVSN